MPIYKFLCDDAECEHVTEFLHLAKVRDDGTVGTDPCPESAACEVCNGTTKKVFEAPGMSRVSYERNGRKAFEIRTDGGGRRTVSATREKYEHMAGNVTTAKLKELKKNKDNFIVESVYTKEVQKVVDQKKDAEKRLKDKRKK